MQGGDRLVVKEEATAQDEAEALEQTAGDKPGVKSRRLGDFSLTDEAGTVEPLGAAAYGDRQLFITGETPCQCQCQCQCQWPVFLPSLCPAARPPCPACGHRVAAPLPLPQSDAARPAPASPFSSFSHPSFPPDPRFHLCSQAWCTPWRVRPARTPAAACSASARSAPGRSTCRARRPRWCWPRPRRATPCCARPPPTSACTRTWRSRQASPLRCEKGGLLGLGASCWASLGAPPETRACTDTLGARLPGHAPPVHVMNTHTLAQHTRTRANPSALRSPLRYK